MVKMHVSIQIHDKANQRTILLTQNGHSDTMLWSFWTETGRSLKDTHPDAYKHFVCRSNCNFEADTGAYEFADWGEVNSIKRIFKM